MLAYILVIRYVAVSPRSDLCKPALYQSTVVVSSDKRDTNELYRAGATLFT